MPYKLVIPENILPIQNNRNGLTLLLQVPVATSMSVVLIPSVVVVMSVFSVNGPACIKAFSSGQYGGAVYMTEII